MASLKYQNQYQNKMKQNEIGVIGNIGNIQVFSFTKMFKISQILCFMLKKCPRRYMGLYYVSN